VHAADAEDRNVARVVAQRLALLAAVGLVAAGVAGGAHRATPAAEIAAYG
jgi:hypothetical protein